MFWPSKATNVFTMTHMVQQNEPLYWGLMGYDGDRTNKYQQYDYDEMELSWLSEPFALGVSALQFIGITMDDSRN